MAICQRRGPQNEVIGIEVVRLSPSDPLDLDIPKRRLDCTDNIRRDVVLQVKDVGKSPVNGFTQKMGAGFRVHELTRNADAIAGFADASLQQVVDTQLPANLPRIDRLTFIDE